jgi:cytochrome b561
MLFAMPIRKGICIVKTSQFPPLSRGLKKHHPLTIALHWGTVLCIVLAVSSILFREVIGDKFWRILLLDTHKQCGLLIMLAVAARLYVRQRHGMANHMQGLPHLMQLAAKAAHWMLYAALVALPLLGWAATNAHNVGVRLFGLIPLPGIAEVDSEWADTLSDYHALGAWILLGMVVMHVGAAMFHHFIRRDTVLWAMLPEKPPALPELSPGALRRRSGMTK